MCARSKSMILADLPERAELTELERQLDLCRDEIAHTDLEIEILRRRLAQFEAVYLSRLAPQLNLSTRLQGLVRHLERWIELVARTDRRHLANQGRRIDRRRHRETQGLWNQRVAREKAGEGKDPKPPESAPTPNGDKGLKTAYRRLVRHYHPDLARTEEQRLKSCSLMQRINDLYQAGDTGRLLALAEHMGEDLNPEPEPIGLVERVTLAAERLSWFEAVVENLAEELAELEACELHQLWLRAAQERAANRDLFDELAPELQERNHRQLRDVDQTIIKLESVVKQYNRDHSSSPPLLPARSKKETALQRGFDPFSDKTLVRLGLETLDARSIRPAARRRATWIGGLAEEVPPTTLRLLLLTHVAQLSHLPLTGLESLEDLRLRFEALREPDEPPLSLEESLAASADLVEYGVRRATEQLIHLGLRFRSETTAEAMPLALASTAVRRVFRSVLSVLGEHTHCRGCDDTTFAVPLYRTRGLDNLRATVCPRCGRTQARYYMPRGKDVQAILNSAYVDLGLLGDWSFRLARVSVATQLLPVEEETLTVGELKQRLVQDLFARYDLGVTRGQVRLHQGRQRIRESTPLLSLSDQRFTVRFADTAPLTVPDAVEVLRHRIRHKFEQG
jgi:hypothetical protein